jgi:hypothetical protein
MKKLNPQDIIDFLKDKFPNIDERTRIENSIIHLALNYGFLSEGENFLEYGEAIDILKDNDKEHPKYDNSRSFVLTLAFNDFSLNKDTKDLNYLLHLITKEIRDKKIKKTATILIQILLAILVIYLIVQATANS